MTNTQHILHRTLDIGSGLILSIIIQLTVFPWFNIFIDVWAMFHLALIFTVVGITRSICGQNMYLNMEKIDE